MTVLGAPELDPYEGKLPTSRLLLPLFKVMSVQTWHDSTGKVIPNYNPASNPSFGTFGAASVSLAESPDRPTFMVLGHIIFAMAFGYSGAHFAVAVYRKQNDNRAE